MAKLLLLLAIICVGASFAFYTANASADGAPNWASSVCSAAQTLCHDPFHVALAGGLLAALAIALKFVSVVRD